ncbi:HTH luxR-type domain-containing protein [Citrobacter freundii]
MAFRWNKESLAVRRENAGVFTTEQIAGMLHTNITVVRNMAYRLKLSLRVSAYNQKRIEQVQTLYTSSEPLNLKEIAAKTGLTFSTVQYIVYVKLKSKPYTKREYVSFETDDAVHYRIQREFIDTERSLLHNIPDNTRFHQLYLTDGTLYCARNIRSEVIICE